MLINLALTNLIIFKEYIETLNRELKLQRNNKTYAWQVSYYILGGVYEKNIINSKLIISEELNRKKEEKQIKRK